LRTSPAWLDYPANQTAKGSGFKLALRPSEEAGRYINLYLLRCRQIRLLGQITTYHLK